MESKWSASRFQRSNKDWQQFNNPKEKKQAVLKEKKVEQIPNKVRALLVSSPALGFVQSHHPSEGSSTAASISSSSGLVTLMRSAGAAYTPGVVLAVDLPFVLLRNLSTILMTRLHNAMSSSVGREEYEALATNFVDVVGSASTANAALNNSSSSSAATNRKALKQVVFQLYTYAKQVTGTSGVPAATPAQGHSGKQGGGSASSSSSASSGGGSASSEKGASGAGTHIMLQLFLYSIGDDQLDFLCCDARALLNAKLA